MTGIVIFYAFSLAYLAAGLFLLIKGWALRGGLAMLAFALVIVLFNLANPILVIPLPIILIVIGLAVRSVRRIFAQQSPLP